MDLSPLPSRSFVTNVNSFEGFLKLPVFIGILLLQFFASSLEPLDPLLRLLGEHLKRLPLFTGPKVQSREVQAAEYQGIT